MDTNTEIDWNWDAIGGQETKAQEALDNPAAVNAAISSLLGEQDEIEPPKPVSDRVQLPGGLYRNGTLLRDAQVKELTGEDEEALAAMEGSLARWVSLMLERAVVSVGGIPVSADLVQDLLIGDRDALLLAVRIATFGEEITAHQVQCPHCEKYFDATVSLSTVEEIRLETPMPHHEYSVELRRGGTALVRLPNGLAQEDLFADADGEVSVAHRNSILLGHCVQRVETADGQVLPEQGEALARKLGMADRQRILKFIADTQPGPQLETIKFLHMDCGREVRLPLTLPELFRGE